MTQMSTIQIQPADELPAAVAVQAAADVPDTTKSGGLRFLQFVTGIVGAGCFGVSGWLGTLDLKNIPCCVLIALLPFSLFYRIVMYLPLRTSHLNLPEKQPWPRSLEGAKVSIIIPAYNEEGIIKETVETALKSTSASKENLEVIVVDDQSKDQTWQIISAIEDDRFLPVCGAVRDSSCDWKGKNWAVWQGFMESTGSVIIVMDGDVLLQPNAIEDLLARFTTKSAEWLTVCCFSDFRNVWEFLLALPCLIGMNQALLAPEIERGEKTYAYGQLNVFRRETYEKLGGHKRVGAVVAETHMLATLAKQSKIPMQTTIATSQTKLLWYAGFDDTWQGTLKSVCARVQKVPACLRILLVPLPIIAAAIQLASWLMPAPLIYFLVTSDERTVHVVGLALAVLQTSLVFVQRWIGWQYLRYPSTMWWAEPASVCVHCAMQLRAIASPYAKWKGKVQTTPKGKRDPADVPHADIVRHVQAFRAENKVYQDRMTNGPGRRQLQATASHLQLQAFAARFATAPSAEMVVVPVSPAVPNLS